MQYTPVISEFVPKYEVHNFVENFVNTMQTLRLKACVRTCTKCTSEHLLDLLPLPNTLTGHTYTCMCIRHIINIIDPGK